MTQIKNDESLFSILEKIMLYGNFLENNVTIELEQNIYKQYNHVQDGVELIK